MNERELLLRGILEQPDCDTARLVFADWLEENGEGKRAEFIRVQIQIARLPGEEQCPQCYSRYMGQQHTNGPCRCSVQLRKLRASEREIFRHNSAWSGWRENPVRADVLTYGEFRALILGKIWGCLFARGFVEPIACPCESFLKHAALCFAANPVASVRLIDKLPAHGGTQTQHRYGWWRNKFPGWVEEPDLIPYSVWDAMPAENATTDWKFYDTSELALLALSQGCVIHGRELAGLPALQPQPTPA